jgi:hypothetical protein
MAGMFTWALLIEIYANPPLALGGAILAAFLSESAQHRSYQNRLIAHSTGLKNQLNRSFLRISELQINLTETNNRLQGAVDEIYRRDTIGSPATRKLLARQEEAMAAQSRAIENRGDKNEDLLDSLERLLMMQSDQTSRIQRTLTDVLTQLALEPRQNVTMSDSVLVQERPTQVVHSATHPPSPSARSNAPMHHILTDLFD